MTTIDFTPLSRHRRGHTKGFTPADLKYLGWIKDRERTARQDAYRAAKQALPKISSRKRRAILATIKAEG